MMGVGYVGVPFRLKGAAGSTCPDDASTAGNEVIEMVVVGARRSSVTFG